ncbi:DNA glycosylase [Mergibacter septicus]|uniref:hypothetical protein n=1 Tax=Mergibacter septicus TaxID=221402 RepID=UPI0011796650|nr:hypothetical protein [Mergibacter septicus]AWX14145.1 DNA glycosylase [Mergibacter septicus]
MARFYHRHPYPPFIPEGATKLIVGTLPPPRFSIPALKEGDVDFCYGTRDGLLWRILGNIFSIDFPFETSQRAIDSRVAFLTQYKIGICDMVESCYRQKIDASDLGMEQIQLRNLLAQLENHPTISTILFTGGNSKNGPEYLFRRHLKQQQLHLTLITADSPKIHRFSYAGREITTVSLIAPSGSANRAIGSIPLYKQRKQENPAYSPFDFRVEQYRPFFKGN